MAKIIIVDDEPAIRLLVTAALEDEGYELLEAVDGKEALELIYNEKPDLVILDVMMPGMTGYELCYHLKQDQGTRGIRVLMLTAKGQARDKAQSKEAGADYYLRKPFSPLELVDLVAELLEK